MAHPGDGLTCSESGHGLTCSVRCLEMVCPCLSAGRWSVPVQEMACPCSIKAQPGHGLTRLEMVCPCSSAGRWSVPVPEVVCPRPKDGLSFSPDFDRFPWNLRTWEGGRISVAWIFNPCRWLGFSIRGPNTHGARGRLVFGRFSILLSLLLVPSRIANPRHGHGVQLRATCGVLLLPSDFYSRPR